MTAYRRWLGFVSAKHPHELATAPADRITRVRIREYIAHLVKDMKPVSVAINIEGLCYAARFMDPPSDWQWLAAIASRLRARSIPEDHFPKLVPGWLTLDYGIRLMEEASNVPSKQREIQYRDGLFLAFESCWPLRRRSVAALTVGHLEIRENQIHVLLYAEDTKSRRAECCPLADRLVPYLMYYLHDVRPRLLGAMHHDGLWASHTGRALSAGRLYDIARLHTGRAFGKPMGLHDFRRAAATFLATKAPEMVGLIPGVLQQAGPEVGEKHYNLSRSIAASRRLARTMGQARDELRLRIRSDHQTWSP